MHCGVVDGDDDGGRVGAGVHLCHRRQRFSCEHSVKATFPIYLPKLDFTVETDPLSLSSSLVLSLCGIAARVNGPEKKN
jgi:hypothetical protein